MAAWGCAFLTEGAASATGGTMPHRRVCFALLALLAACAPQPTALVGELHQLEQLAVRVRDAAMGKRCAAAPTTAACGRLMVCGAQLVTSARRCQRAIHLGASGTDADYSAAALGCTDESRRAKAECESAGLGR